MLSGERNFCEFFFFWIEDFSGIPQASRPNTNQGEFLFCSFSRFLVYCYKSYYVSLPGCLVNDLGRMVLTSWRRTYDSSGVIIADTQSMFLSRIGKRHLRLEYKEFEDGMH